MDVNTICELEFTTLANFIAISIAVLALVVSIWQACETNRNYRLSILPKIIILGKFTDDNDICGLVFENKGLGPAIITKIEICVDKQKNYNIIDPEERIQFDQEFNTRILTSGINAKVNHRSYDDGDMIMSGETSRFIWTNQKDKDDETIQQLRNLFSSLNIKITYQSIYRTKLNTTYP